MAPNQQEPGAPGDGRSESGTVMVEHLASGPAVVSLHGEHDLSTEGALTKALATAAEHSDVLVDLSGCTFIDSTGIAALLRAARTARAGGERFAVVIPPERANLARLAALTRLEEAFPLHASLGAALADFAGSEPT
jgi:anti-sigma B factor antagonist